MNVIRRASSRKENREEAVILDDRERASGLDECLARTLGHPPVVRRLAVGDILIRKRILIERKTAADFEASMLDGRLFAQAEALAGQPFDALILIEGAFQRESNHLSGSALRQAMLSLVMDWRVPLLRSASLQDTALWVQALLSGKRRRAEPPDWRRVTPAGARRPAGPHLHQPRKRPVPAPERARRQTQAILSAIEGVGPARARALTEAFGSLSGVMAAEHDELARVPGVGTQLAARIRQALQGEARR
jgi:Fanconi anemia group M protein